MQQIDTASDQIISAVRTLSNRPEGFIPLHEPFFNGNEKDYVVDCVESGWVSSVGQYVNLFEEKLAEYTGVKKAVVTVNGTAALHIALLLGGVEPGDEVLMPALSFIATANAVAYCGAYPHFVDSEIKTLGPDMNGLKDYLRDIGERKFDGKLYNKHTGRRISAFVPMHTFGHPVDIEEARSICDEFSIALIEDAAESLGSFYKGKHTGNWGDLSALSFNGNKVMTTGGGGAILTNNEKLGKLAKHITTTAKVPHAYEFYHDQLGYNYRMPNLNAALGCAQLEQIDDFLSKKRKLAEAYKKQFANSTLFTFFEEVPDTKANYWLNTIVLNKAHQGMRDRILEETNAAGVMTRPVWQLLNRMPMYSSSPSMPLSGATELEKSIINIPSSVNLALND